MSDRANNGSCGFRIVPYGVFGTHEGTETMPPNAGLVLQGRYRIEYLLGQGGMGAVYCGTDLRFNTPVAIKENRLVTRESKKQFAREAGLLHRLRHPNLPRVTDHFFIPGQGQYLVMDFVEGEDLNQVLVRQGLVPQAQALDWMGQVLDALDYLHSKNVIHRDVKPANVKITSEGQVFLVDFGLAKTYHPALETTIGARGVTPGFAPPEQYGQGRTDARTDVYAAGATLYALVTGQPPPGTLEMVTQEAELVAPRQVNPAVSPEVESAILRAMQLAPNGRFQSAAEFGSALLEPAPPVARPQPVEEDQATTRAWPNDRSGAEQRSFLVQPAGTTVRDAVPTEAPTDVVPPGLSTKKPGLLFGAVGIAAVGLILVVIWLASLQWKGDPEATAQALAASWAVQTAEMTSLSTALKSTATLAPTTIQPGRTQSSPPTATGTPIATSTSTDRPTPTATPSSTVAPTDDSIPITDGTANRVVLLRTLEEHGNWVNAVAFSADGQLLASGSDDGTVRLWRVGDWTMIRALQTSVRVMSVAFSPDMSVLASGSGRAGTGSEDFGIINLWRISDGTLLRTLQGHGFPPQSLAFSPAGDLLASASPDWTVRLWRVSDGMLLHTFHHSGLSQVAFSPDGTRLAATGHDRIQVWRIPDGTLEQVLQPEPQQQTLGVAFSPDGLLLAAGTLGGAIPVWNLADGHRWSYFQGHELGVKSLSWSPNGGILASGGGEGTVHLWGAARRNLGTLEGHTNAVTSLAFSPNTTILVSGSRDGTVRLWGVP